MKNDNNQTTTNPLRAIFLSLSKMPPAVMLLIIIGMAIVVTMMVTGQVTEEAKQYESKRDALEHQRGISSLETAAPTSNTGSAKTAYFALTYIPSGSTIENKQISARKIGELELWDDAVIVPTEIVGHSAKHAIPMNAQIRQGDLQ